MEDWKTYDWGSCTGILEEYTGNVKATRTPEKVRHVISYAFSSSILKELTISDGIVSISGPLFGCNANIERVIFEAEEIREVTGQLFRYCSGLRSVEFNNCRMRIPDLSFWDCTSLETIVLPRSITSIGDEVFEGCTALKKVVICNPDIVLGKNIFDGANPKLEVDFIGNSEKFLEISSVRKRNEVYSNATSAGNYYYHFEESPDTTWHVNSSVYPFGRRETDVVTKVHCFEDGVTLLFYADAQKAPVRLS